MTNDRRGSSRAFPRCRRLLTVVVAALPMILLLAACEYPGVPSPHAATESPDGATPTGSPAEHVDSPTASPEETETPALEGTITVALREFELVPNELTVKAGEVTFFLPNEGRFTHDFRIDNDTVDLNSGKVGARREKEWQVTLEPGEYRLSCRISNHDERGMVGTMTVVP